MILTPLPAPLRLRDPAVLIATGFGSGLFTPAPGTWGTLAAWLVGIIITLVWGKPVLFLALLVYLGASLWAVGRFENATGLHDSGLVVADEWVGMWIALMLSGPYWDHVFLALVMFRLLDIWKPGPIGWIDRNVQGPMGVIMDDALAGTIAGLCVYGYALWTM